MSADDDYANSAHIPEGDSFYARWDAAAAAFRAAQGSNWGNTNDELYHPERKSRGTVVFVHGGYWMAGLPSMFSHVAAGAVANGYACALPAYTLAPDASITDITRQIADKISERARAADGPLYLVGHSAGAHLVARMACADMVADWSDRVARVLAISPISDLAPLMQTRMNETLKIDAAEARAQSLIHHKRQDIPVTVWVGADERPAFLDQARWLVDAWGCEHVIQPNRHHFNVIKGLETPDSAMMHTLLA